MTSYTWILLILASLAATRAQDLDLSDSLFDDDKPPAAVKPAPPKNSNPDLDLSSALDLDEESKKTPRERGTGGGADPGYDDESSGASEQPQGLDLSDSLLDDKPPAAVKPAPPKNSNPDLDLSSALDLDEESKKTPRERGTGGGSFGDTDLLDVNEGVRYVPDKGRTGGGGADPGYDDESSGASEQPQDLNQKWLQLIKMLDVKIPEGLSVWIAQFLQAVEPLLEQFQGFLNVTEEKAEL